MTVSRQGCEPAAHGWLVATGRREVSGIQTGYCKCGRSAAFSKTNAGNSAGVFVFQNQHSKRRSRLCGKGLALRKPLLQLDNLTSRTFCVQRYVLEAHLQRQLDVSTVPGSREPTGIRADDSIAIG